MLTLGDAEDLLIAALLESDAVPDIALLLATLGLLAVDDEPGLPVDFDIPAFTVGAKRRAVGNGVPLPMAKALASAVMAMTPSESVKLCGCGCGRVVTELASYAGSGCRMRMMRRRHLARQGQPGT